MHVVTTKTHIPMESIKYWFSGRRSLLSSEEHDLLFTVDKLLADAGVMNHSSVQRHNDGSITLTTVSTIPNREIEQEIRLSVLGRDLLNRVEHCDIEERKRYGITVTTTVSEE